MNTELMEVKAPTVTADQIDLIKRTVANGATADELKLYLFDCARQGVHPLDKLIHFTIHKSKNGDRKYTPVTSIDFMRIRAAETNEYAGSDDAVFVQSFQDGGPPQSATVTVWRLVQGQRCAFTATARWAEYKPDTNDFMWRRMPHGQLAKCAEALALRKGFPRQLAGLYAREEMDQAGVDHGHPVEAPTVPPTSQPANGGGPRVEPSAGEIGSFVPGIAEPVDVLPEGAVLITSWREGKGSVKAFVKHTGQQGGDDDVAIFKEQSAIAAEQAMVDKAPVRLTLKLAKTTGKPYIEKVERVLTEVQIARDEAHLQPLNDDDIPF